MKDTLITAKRKKQELITLLICFILANLANLYSIIVYHTQFSELITSLLYVSAFTVALYIFWSLLRLFLYELRLLFLKKSGRKIG
ncbi:hypothetical protein FQ707_06080 [Bacteroidaceae bacterium HV4-6-C5C]|nr:hypothetical protein FQ707_06080 [Bacteroidaceae bacterium HV4-6-C5C]